MPSRKTNSARGKRDPIEWKSIDWSLSDQQIAAATRCTLKYVAVNRRVFANHTTVSRKRKSVDWKAVDWAKTNQEIAKETGCTPGTVKTMRWNLNSGQRKRAKKKTPVSLPAIDPGTVDWSLSHREIAKRHDIHIAQVRLLAIELEKRSIEATGDLRTLIELRLEAGVSQLQCSHILGIASRDYKKIESKEETVDPKLLKLYIKVLREYVTVRSLIANRRIPHA